jgi:hypothetical protein
MSKCSVKTFLMHRLRDKPFVKEEEMSPIMESRGLKNMKGLKI